MSLPLDILEHELSKIVDDIRQFNQTKQVLYIDRFSISLSHSNLKILKQSAKKLRAFNYTIIDNILKINLIEEDSDLNNTT